MRTNEARIISLLGALLLLIGLLPAGATGPAQEFARGSLPPETLFLLLLAAAMRAGVYPFHLWLLPRTRDTLNLSERLLDHMVPVLCGLWLFGWTFQLGAADLMISPLVLTLLALALLATAVAAWTAEDQLHHVTFVLVGSAGVAVLAGQPWRHFRPRRHVLGDNRLCAGRRAVAGGRPGVAGLGLATAGQFWRAGAGRRSIYARLSGPALAGAAC